MRAPGSLEIKLFYSPFHSFAHKTLIVAHEAGLWERLTLVPTFPFRNLDAEFVTGQYDMSAIAPLGKVPCLATEDGAVLYASQTIVEYLNAHRAENALSLYPAEGPARWDALTRLALGDAIFEFAVQLSMEGWIERELRRPSIYEWLWPKIIAALDHLESIAAAPREFDVGDAGILQGISYLAAKAENSDDDPVCPNYDWRHDRPALAAWYDQAMQRLSVQQHYQRDYEGDLSAVNHQRHVAEVLAAKTRSSAVD